MTISAVTDSIQDSFREVMSNVCTPVTVVSTLVDGRPHATTVSAFASLSMSPPMVLIALDEHSDLLTAVRETRRFGVSVLGSAQAALASQFARKGAEKFEGVAWAEHDALPRLDDAHGWLACEVVDLVAAGDHVVVMGAVEVAEAADSLPLTYFRRAFGTHRTLGG